MKILDLSSMDSSLTNELNQKADDLIRDYTVFIDSIIDKQTNNIFLSLLPFLSRNRFLSNVFLNVSILFLTIDYIEKYNDIEYVVLPYRGIADSLRKYLYKRKIKGIQISYINKRPCLLVLLKQWLNTYITYFQEWYNIKKYSQKKHDLEKPFEMIDTYVLSSLFNGDEFHDRYFNDLEKYTDKNLIFSMHPIINDRTTWKEFIYAVEACKSRKFLFKEKFIKLRDILFISFLPLNHLFYCLTRKIFLNIDITSIINEDVCLTLPSLNTIIGVSYYIFIKNMYKKKVPINSLIGWYEGQPSSIGLFKAFRKYYKNKYSIGYVGMPIFHNNYGICPSVGQIRTKTSPEYIGVIGRVFKEYLLQHNPDVFIKEVPAFRYQDVFKIKDEFFREESDNIIIFVILTYNIQTSSDTIQMLLDYINKNKTMKFDIRMKNHPVYNKYILSDYKIEKKTVPNNCYINFIDDNIVSYSKKVDIIILAGFSSSLFELLLANKPILQREELGTLSSLRRIMDRYTNCFFSFYEEKDFANTLDYVISKGRIISEANDFKEIFIKPTVENVKQLFS